MCIRLFRESGLSTNGSSSIFLTLRWWNALLEVSITSFTLPLWRRSRCSFCFKVETARDDDLTGSQQGDACQTADRSVNDGSWPGLRCTCDPCRPCWQFLSSAPNWSIRRSELVAESLTLRFVTACSCMSSAVNSLREGGLSSTATHAPQAGHDGTGAVLTSMSRSLHEVHNTEKGSNPHPGVLHLGDQPQYRRRLSPFPEV